MSSVSIKGLSIFSQVVSWTVIPKIIRVTPEYYKKEGFLWLL